MEKRSGSLMGVSRAAGQVFAKKWRANNLRFDLDNNNKK
jgi:hypothetical protein